MLNRIFPEPYQPRLVYAENVHSPNNMTDHLAHQDLFKNAPIAYFQVQTTGKF